MAMGLHETRTSHRRQRRKNFLKNVILFGAALFLGLFSYQTGSTLAEREVSRLRAEIEELLLSIESLRDENARAQGEIDGMRQKDAEWQQRYERDVPNGPAKKLLGMIQGKLAGRVDPQRLEFLISIAGNETACDRQPVTRRFLVRTPLSRGTNDSVSFANNLLTVTAEGVAQKDGEGKPLAWFDPAGAVTIQFAEPGGRSTQASGVLPLHHSVRINDAEYRFSAVLGDSRGFINVTVDRCRFP